MRPLAVQIARISITIIVQFANYTVQLQQLMLLSVDSADSEFLARDSIYAERFIILSPVRLSVHLPVTRVDQSKQLKLGSCNFHCSTE